MRPTACFQAARVTIALLAIVLASCGAAKGAGYSMINDVSTDLENPPRLSVGGQDVAFPGNARRALEQGGPKPWLVKASLDMAQRAVLGAIAGRSDWALGENQPGRITFVATSRIFRFKDDVVVRLQQAPEGIRVDVRSRSRVGKGDFGANAKRINQLLAAARALLPD